MSANYYESFKKQYKINYLFLVTNEFSFYNKINIYNGTVNSKLSKR